MIQYGLVSNTDARTIEKTIDLICNEFKDEFIYVTEIGVYAGDTGFGITEYVASKNEKCILTGIENNKDGERIKTFYDNLIVGNSNEVYYQIEDNSQHLIFVDGCHCFAHVISDFFCYSHKVKAGGYMVFHDTGNHIRPFKDFQHGNKNNPDACISVRKALIEIGLMGFMKDFKVERLRFNEGELMVGEGYTVVRGTYPGWKLVFDKADENNEAGGVCVFKKIIQ